jgi:transposase-like protein
MSDALASIPQKRCWPVSEKRRIVELSLRNDARVRDVAKQFSLDPPTLSSWRTLYRQGKLVESSSPKKKLAEIFLPVTVTASNDQRPASPSKMLARIDLPCGTSLRIEAEMLDFQGLGTILASVRK